MDKEPIRRALLLFALAILPVLAFGPGLTSPLTHFDDPLYLERAEYSRPGLSGLDALWQGTRAWSGTFVEYFPLRDSVYWTIFQVFQLQPLPYHLASLFFHIATTFLVFAFVRKIEQPRWVSAGAALLFAVHPIHIESVVWVAGLKDPMYTCLLLGCLWLYCHYRQRPSAAIYALSLLLMVAALLVKSMALSAPLILVAIERCVGRTTPWKTIAARLAGPGLICVLFLGQFVALGRINDVRSTLHQDSAMAHVVLSAWAQVAYVRQVVFPSSFRLIYCFAPVESLADGRLLAAVALLVAVVAALWVWRRRPERQLALAFYFACLLPVSNLLPFSAVMADRYLYAASIGACLLIAQLLAAARERLRNTVLALVVLTFTATTALRSAVWQDEEMLWEEADEDPVCMQDPEFPAAFVHFLRYATAADDETRLSALTRLLDSRAAAGSGLRCDAWLNGAQLLSARGDHARAGEWTQQATASCASHRLLPQTVMLVTLHRDLTVAEYAAAKWYRLDPRPESGLFRMLTQLESAGITGSAEDASRQAGILAVVKSAPHLTCPLLTKWAGEVGAALKAAVSESIDACAALDAH